MLKLFQPKHPSILGLDISASSINLLGISGSGQELCVEGYAREVLPPHVLEGGLIKDLDSLALGIKKIHKDSGLSSTEAALALPDCWVIKHLIQLPSGLTELEMEELILIEMEQLLSYPADKISFDFEILGASVKNPAMLDLYILAARTELIAAPVEALTCAGLQAKIVDVYSHAVERAMRRILKEGFCEYQGKVLALMDIGNCRSRLFIFREGKIIYSREEQNSFLPLPDFCNAMDHPMNQISKITSEHMLSEQDEDIFREKILSKIKGHLQFFYSSNPQSLVDTILLAGEAIKADLDVFIQEQLKIKTEIANPLKGMSVNNKVKTKSLYHEAPALMAACGLALRSIKYNHERL